MINRIATLTASAVLSTFAYIYAPDAPKVQHIDFAKPIVISIPVENITFTKPIVITAKKK